MNVCVCLPEYRAYRDRYRMFAAVATTGIDVHIVLLRGLHPPPQTGAAAVHTYTLTGSRRARAQALHALVNTLVATNAPTVLQDTFLARLASHAPTSHRRRASAPLRTVLSLYSATPTFFLKRRWMGSRTSDTRLTLGEWPYFLTRYPRLMLMEYRSVHRVNAVIGNSDDVRRDVTNAYRVPPSNFFLIPSEIDTEFFSPGPAACRLPDVPPDARLLLCAGKFQRVKGMDILLKAFDVVATADPRAHLLMVGEVGAPHRAWYEPLLRRLRHRDRVHLHPPMEPEALRDCYRRATLFVLPTFHEGSPRVVREAMACGCPVLTSAIQGNLAIDPLGHALCYASAWEAQEYARLVLELLRDDATRLARRNAGLALAQTLTLANVAAHHVRVYRKILNETWSS